METNDETQESPRTHHGHAIRRIRESRRLSQQKLGELTHMVQQNVSMYENQKVIKDQILDLFAAALHVDVELIKSMEDYSPDSYYMENNNSVSGNTFENECSATIAPSIINSDSVTNNYNGADKELYLIVIKMKDKINFLENEIKQLKGDKDSDSQ